MVVGDATIGFGETFLRMGFFDMSRLEFIIGDLSSYYKGEATLSFNSLDSSVFNLYDLGSDFYLCDFGVVALYYSFKSDGS